MWIVILINCGFFVYVFIIIQIKFLIYLNYFVDNVQPPFMSFITGLKRLTIF